MKHAHRIHRHAHKANGGATKYPPHLGKHKKSGPGPAEVDGVEGEPHQGGKKSSVNTDKPKVVSGNPVVLSAAGETKSIGEVPGIYAKKRLDRVKRPGGQSGI